MIAQKEVSDVRTVPLYTDHFYVKEANELGGYFIVNGIERVVRLFQVYALRGLLF
jgi:DNA-directed RNA polymerase beta subunit